MLRFTLFISTLILSCFTHADSESTASEVDVKNNKRFSIIHFNDLHSRFQGFAPTIDFSPFATNNDATKGGWSRIATHVKQIKAEREQPVIGLNAGDFSMGSLFHMGIRETGMELQLMKQIGIDITTLGNHEFDLGPDGLARILESAYKAGGIPEIVYSNIVFDPNATGDDSLQQVFEQHQIPPYIVKNINGVTVGFYGMMGNDAVEVSPFAKPLTFKNTVETSKQMVKVLREEHEVDLVVFISHSGIWQDKSISEDEIIAQQVDGIDVIVSGHTSKELKQPLNVNNTIIVHAGAYGKFVGVMDLSFETGNLVLENYHLQAIDDAILGDEQVQKQIDDYAKSTIETLILTPESLEFNQIVAETQFPLLVNHAESNVGALVADSIRWHLTELDPNNPVAFAIESNGLVRDHILVGETGKISVADAFSVMPLGIGQDGSMGYPLVSFYVTAAEIKDALEVTTSVVPLKGDAFYLHVSGLKYQYNPNRIFFDRVTGIQQLMPDGSYQELDYSSNNTKLYRVAANLYNATMMTLVEDFTKGILTIIPKDKNGVALDGLTPAMVDASPEPGMQETKQWVSLIRYLQSFPDTNNNQIADIPESYNNLAQRTIAEPSWHPFKLIGNGAFITWLVSLIILSIISALIWWPIRWLWKG